MARAQRTVARTVPGSLPVMQQKATRSSRITATFRFFLGFRKRARKPMSTLTWNPEITTTSAQAHPVEVVLVDVLQPRLVPHEQGAEKARLLLGVETVNLIHNGARQKGEVGAEGEPLRGQDGNLVPGLHLEEVALAGVVEGLLPLDAVGGGALGHGFDPVPRTQGEEVTPPHKRGP